MTPLDCKDLCCPPLWLAHGVSPACVLPASESRHHLFCHDSTKPACAKEQARQKLTAGVAELSKLSPAQMTELVREASNWAFRLDMQESKLILLRELGLVRMWLADSQSDVLDI